MCSYSSYSSTRYRYYAWKVHADTVTRIGAPTIPLAVPVGISIAHTLHYSREKLAAGRQVREDDAEGAW